MGIKNGPKSGAVSPGLFGECRKEVCNGDEIMIIDSEKVHPDAWRNLLKSSGNATIYHTPEWKKFLETTFRYTPRYLFAQNDSGELTGMLPLFQIKGIMGGSRLCSTPFAHDCGPLGQPEVCGELVHAALDLCSTFRLKNLEIRGNGFPGLLTEVNNFSTYILPLSQNIPDVWKRLDKGSTRWAITKATKSNVSVGSTRNSEDLKEFYELNCLTKKELGVPCHPLKFFKNLFATFGDSVSLYVAQHNTRIIGGGIMLRFKDTVLYGYGGAHPGCLKVNPYNAFIWKSIEDACNAGYTYFDFGRTSYDNTGLIQFKKKWGTVEKKLYYYYQNYSGSTALDRTSLFCKTANLGLRKMPMPLYKSVSQKLFAGIG